MTDWGVIEVERQRGDERESNDRRVTGNPPPDAEELERIVDVAEWLGISPTVASAALREGDGGIRTDVRLSESIRHVERRLRRER